MTSVTHLRKCTVLFALMFAAQKDKLPGRGCRLHALLPAWVLSSLLPQSKTRRVGLIRDSKVCLVRIVCFKCVCVPALANSPGPLAQRPLGLQLPTVTLIRQRGWLGGWLGGCLCALWPAVPSVVQADGSAPSAQAELG